MHHRRGAVRGILWILSPIETLRNPSQPVAKRKLRFEPDFVALAEKAHSDI